MRSSEALPEILRTIAEALDHILALKAVAIFSDESGDLYHWIGNRDTALRLCEWIDARTVVREAEGRIEDIATSEGDMADVRFVAAYPVLTSQGPETLVIAIAGTNGGQRDAAWAMLQMLVREAAGELLVRNNAPSIYAALEDTPVGISVASMLVADAPLVYVNPGFERITGYTRAEVTGHNCRFLQEKHANKRQRRIIRDAMAAGQGCMVEIENVRKDGRSFTSRLTLRPVYTGDRRPSYYLGFQEDISALRQAEHAKQAILDASPVALLVVDNTGAILRANAYAEHLLGYESGALSGCAVETLIPAPMRDRHVSLRAGFHQSPSRREMGPDRELQALRKDGTEFPIEVGLAPYQDGETTCVVAAIIDITERKKLESSQREAAQEAARGKRSQASLFANVSHEFKTPLNAIIGFSHILKTKPPGSQHGPREIDYAKDINESAQILLGTINQLLKSAKIAAQKWEITADYLDVAELLHQEVQRFTPFAQEKKLDLRVKIAAIMPFLWADERSLQEMLAQILSNAIKFTPAGGRIDVEARILSESEVSICVTDTGSGMDEDKKRRALEPFDQVEDVYTRHEGGLGLGLLIVDSLVQLHQGRLEIDSDKDSGTTLRIVLPADRSRTNAVAGYSLTS